MIGRLMATGLICGDGITYSYYSSRSKIHYDNVHAVYIADEVKKLLPDPLRVFALPSLWK